jgi:uncharacterized membrane protein
MGSLLARAPSSGHCDWTAARTLFYMFLLTCILFLIILIMVIIIVLIELADCELHNSGMSI